MYTYLYRAISKIDGRVIREGTIEAAPDKDIGQLAYTLKRELMQSTTPTNHHGTEDIEIEIIDSDGQSR